MVTLDKIKDVLQSSGVTYTQPKLPDGKMFNRNIEFSTKYESYKIVWFANIATLCVGENKGTHFKFDKIFFRDWSCSCEKDLVFGNENNSCIYGEVSVVIEKLKEKGVDKIK